MDHKKPTEGVLIGVGTAVGALLASGIIPMVLAAEATADDTAASPFADISGGSASTVFEPGPVIEPGSVIVGPGGIISDLLNMPINLIDNTLVGISSTVSALLSLEFGTALDDVIGTIQGDINILLSPFFDISGGVIEL